MKSIHWSEGCPKVKQRSISIQPPCKTIEKAWFAQSIHDFDLWLILDGTATLTTEEGESVILSRGSCLWLVPGQVYDFRVSESGSLTTAWTHFDLLDARGEVIPPSRVSIPGPICEIFNMAFFESALRHLVLLRHETRKEVAGQESHLLKALLYEYQLAHEQQAMLQDSGVQKHHQHVISSALSWLYSHPEQAVSAQALARKFGYSLRHFTRIFREITGKTPTQALIQARIDHAKTLLSSSVLNISEIADSLLYENVFYFSRQFKRMVGVSPQQYRKRMTAR